MSIIKPVPIVPELRKNICPICGKASYSRGGIHPQCAVAQADEPRSVRIRLARKKKAEADKARQQKALAKVHARVQG
jgi:hypothetical protein